MGWIEPHTVFHATPSCRASPWMEACSRRTCSITHRHARVVNSPRGRAICSSCSVNTLVGHAGSRHRHVRLRHRSRVGRAKHGMSTSVVVRRPRLSATTPHVGQPITVGADSIVTTSTPWPVLSTSTTCKPSRPTSRSQWSQYEGVVEAQQHPVGSDTSRPSGQVEETLPILKASTPNHPHPALWRVALTPTSRLKSPLCSAADHSSPGLLGVALGPGFRDGLGPHGSQSL